MNSDNVIVGYVYDGGTYSGEVSDGVPHGQGTILLSDFTTYSGEWKDGKPWIGTTHDECGNIIATWSEGVREEE